MDKALRPERLEVLPSSRDATKVYKHWKKTVEYYLAALPQANLNKLHVLTNFVAPDIFDLISEDSTYEAAMLTLDTNFVKTPNVIYARHLLATRKQQPGETLDSYLAALKSLAKDCNFQAVTAAVYQNESICDAFIAGTISTSVRQRLLEKGTITLDEMISTARSLESAEKNAESYSGGSMAAMQAALPVPSPPDESLLAAVTKAPLKSRPNKNGCWNCGQNRHPQSRCPARDAVCHACERTGHFSKMCRSTKNSKQSAATLSEDNQVSFTTASAILTPQLL